MGETLYCITNQPDESTKNLKNAYWYALPKSQNHPSKTYYPRLKIWNLLNHLRNKQASNQPKHNYFVLFIFLTNTQNILQYLYVYGQQQEIPISLLQTRPSHSSMKEMLANAKFCCLSHSYPFGVTNLSTMALHQQFFPTCIIHVHNMIFLAKDM
jgi:hypothetical protein